MKKTIVLGMVGVMAVSSANAGWFGNLFGAKQAEPKTLEEACNKDEITSICPEIILGTKTVQECLMDNISKLSTKCATFVKKSATEKIDAVKQQVADVKDTVKSAKEEQKQAAAAQKEAMKATKSEFKASLKASKDAAKNMVATEKAQLINDAAAAAAANAQ